MASQIGSEPANVAAGALAKAQRQVRNGWIVGALTASVGSLVNGYFLVAGDPRGNVFAFLQLGLWAVLAYGVFRRSRAAAALMLTLFVGEKLFEYFFTAHWGSAALAAVKFYFIAYAVVGAFALHKLRGHGSGSSEA
jgi:hypothetical protein